MATVTVFTAARTQAIEDETIVGAEVVNGHLIFSRHDGTLLDTGPIFAPVVDTAANLASANLIYASGQMIQQSDGAKMLAMGDGVHNYNTLSKYSIGDGGAYQYAYTETTKTAVGSTLIDWTGLTITFTSDGVTPIELECYCPFARGESTLVLPSYPTMAIFEGATLIIAGTGGLFSSAGSAAVSAAIIAKDTRVYSAGAHTVKIQVARQTVGGGSGTILFFAASGFRAYIRSKLAHL